MDEAFLVEPAPPDLGTKQQVVTFTVTPRDTVVRQIRVTLKASEGTPESWLELAGPPLIDVPAGGTAKIEVKIKRPEGGPPGTYGLQLLVADFDAPENRFALGSVVRFSIAAPPPPPQRLPLAVIIGLIALGLAVVGLILFIALQPKESKECEGGLARCGSECIDLNSSSANCGGCGKACAAGASCANGQCAAVVTECTADQINCDGRCTATFNECVSNAPRPPCPAGKRSLVLVSTGANKIAVIKLIRELTGIGLKEAKDLSENTPAELGICLTVLVAKQIIRKTAETGADFDLR